MRTAAGVVDRSPRGAVLVTRPDARSFLRFRVRVKVDVVVRTDWAGTPGLDVMGRGPRSTRSPSRSPVRGFLRYSGTLRSYGL